MREKDKRENKNGKRRGRGKKKEGGKEGRENLGDCCFDGPIHEPFRDGT